MKKLLKAFLEEDIIFDYSNEDFDYNFNTNSSIDLFIKEYKKFIGLYNYLFYHSNRFLTSFNSYEIHLKANIIRQLFNMYLYADRKDLESEKMILIEFLYTYFKTIDSLEYKSNYNKYDEAKKEFKDILREKNLTKMFFTKCKDILYVFYKKMLMYGIDNDIFISGEVINRIFNNLKGDNKYYNELIDLLADNRKNLRNIVYFDNNVSFHVDIYLLYIFDSLDHFGGYNYAKEVLFELNKSHCLDDKMLNEITNKYIEIVNNLCKKLGNKKYNFIQGIAEIDNLRKELLFILKKINLLKEHHKGKIRQCLCYLLRLKRYLLSDDDYVKSEMHEFVFEQKIPNEKVDKYKEALLNNSTSLYAASKINCSSLIGEALESYAKYPLQSLVSLYQIDSVNQIYLTQIEEKKNEDNNFKNFYDEKGNEYTKSHPKLLNKLSNNYYEELLRYLSKTFLTQQNIILSILGHDNFYKIIDDLKDSVGYKIDNQYAIVVSNILAIETNVIKLLKRYNLKVSIKGFDNINILFDYYEDESKKDGLMYLNYTLYEKSGLNLRNGMMHGTMINANLDIALLVTFSGLIFVSWLLNDE